MLLTFAVLTLIRAPLCTQAADAEADAHPLASAVARLPVEVCSQTERLQWHLSSAWRYWACT
jgi:hypothetical protein